MRSTNGINAEGSQRPGNSRRADSLRDRRRDGVVVLYRTGGDVRFGYFCFIPESGPLITLAPLYDALKAGGHTIDAEHVVIPGVPVQFIPAYNPLVIEALSESQERTFGETPTRVLRLEHLLAIMLQTGRPKDWQRAAMVSASAPFDESRLLDVLNRHGLTETWNRIRSPH